jgi:UDP-N-acetylmuramoyl-tripeptide--D-alanyl-D-alanine ligase
MELSTRHEMALFTVEEMLEVISVRVLAGRTPTWLKKRIKRVCTDSRAIRPGDLFVALQGDRFDGHDYVATALRQGAVGAIVHDRFQLPEVMSAGSRGASKGADAFLLGVRDTLFAYQQLASHHRSRFDIPVVAVTGSNGKTTTKDMISHVLAHRWIVLKTEGNLNNRIGVPQILFGLTPRHEAAVIEMGVDNLGQTTRLCEIARPTIGIITNIGPDHLEFFGSMEVSAQAKGELLDLMSADGTAVLNADDDYFDYLAARACCRVVSFGLSSNADVHAVNPHPDEQQGATFGLVLPGRARPTAVYLKVHGSHNITNALAAAAVGFALGLSGSGIAEGLARFRPASMRSQETSWRGVRLINDCYNANPASMRAAILMLKQLGTATRTIAVLGDMLELGPGARDMHREVGAYLVEQGITYLIAAGGLGQYIADGARRSGMASSQIVDVPDAAAAGQALKLLAKKGDVVLVKASRGMKMEQVVDALTGTRRVAKKAS